MIGCTKRARSGIQSCAENGLRGRLDSSVAMGSPMQADDAAVHCVQYKLKYTYLS